MIRYSCSYLLIWQIISCIRYYTFIDWILCERRCKRKVCMYMQKCQACVGCISTGCNRKCESFLRKCSAICPAPPPSPLSAQGCYCRQTVHMHCVVNRLQNQRISFSRIATFFKKKFKNKYMNDLFLKFSFTFWCIRICSNDYSQFVLISWQKY